MLLLLRFFTFLRFFENPETWLFTFFALLYTFSRTMTIALSELIHQEIHIFACLVLAKEHLKLKLFMHAWTGSKYECTNGSGPSEGWSASAVPVGRKRQLSTRGRSTPARSQLTLTARRSIRAICAYVYLKSMTSSQKSDSFNRWVFIYLENIRAKFHPDEIYKDGALGF